MGNKYGIPQAPRDRHPKQLMIGDRVRIRRREQETQCGICGLPLGIGDQALFINNTPTCGKKCGRTLLDGKQAKDS